MEERMIQDKRANPSGQAANEGLPKLSVRYKPK